jgi:FixJ family two-component response regulator
MEQVFLVDDDAGVRRSLARVLNDEGFSVEEFDSAEAFLARTEPPVEGCIVLDVTMPGLDGLELQARLRGAGRDLPIVFVTGYGDIPMSVQAIKAGATDFLTKPVNSRVLIAAVRTAIENAFTDRQARTELAIHKQRFATLSVREREVLEGLVKGKLNKQIAGDLCVVEQTVKWHRGHIMERMHARTVAELMHIAARLGVGGSSIAGRVASPTSQAGKPPSGDSRPPSGAH